jgi:preprotein translocase subunit SecE
MTITNQITQYFKESRVELAKVNWPTRKETARHTAIVIAVSLGLAAFLGAVDYVFNIVLEQLLRIV